MSCQGISRSVDINEEKQNKSGAIKEAYLLGAFEKLKTVQDDMFLMIVATIPKVGWNKDGGGKRTWTWNYNSVPPRDILCSICMAYGQLAVDINELKLYASNPQIYQLLQKPKSSPSKTVEDSP